MKMDLRIGRVLFGGVVAEHYQPIERPTYQGLADFTLTVAEYTFALECLYSTAKKPLKLSAQTEKKRKRKEDKKMDDEKA